MRKKRASGRNESVASRASNRRGAVGAKAEELMVRRLIRGREIGDGGGVDIGIAPGAFGASVEKHLRDTSPETKRRILEHVRQHTDEAMKPLVRLMEREGASEVQMQLFKNVGPNMLRTVIEYLEDASAQS